MKLGGKHIMSCLPDLVFDCDIDHERREVTLRVPHFDSTLVADCVRRVLPGRPELEAATRPGARGAPALHHHEGQLMVRRALWSGWAASVPVVLLATIAGETANRSAASA